MADVQFSIRAIFEAFSKSPGMKAGHEKISSPGFVALCRDIHICTPHGFVEAELVQAAHQKYRASGEKTIPFLAFCSALRDVLLVAQAFQQSLAEQENLDDLDESPVTLALAKIEALLEALEAESAEDTRPKNIPAYVPVYKNWMSSKVPSNGSLSLPTINSPKMNSAPKDRMIQVHRGYQAGHSDDMSPPTKNQKQHSVGSTLVDGPGKDRLQRMAGRIAELEDQRFEAMGGPAHQHAVSYEKIARKLQYMEMRLVKAEGQLAQRQSRITEVEQRCSEADSRFSVQEQVIAKLEAQLDESELERLSAESSLIAIKKQLEVMKLGTQKHEASSTATIKVLEKRVMTVEVKCVGGSKDPKSKGKDSQGPDLLLSGIHAVSTEAVEAKLVASRARDATAKLGKAISVLAAKVEKVSQGSGSHMEQRVQQLEALLADTMAQLEEQRRAAAAAPAGGGGDAKVGAEAAAAPAAEVAAEAPQAEAKPSAAPVDEAEEGVAAEAAPAEASSTQASQQYTEEGVAVEAAPAETSSGVEESQAPEGVAEGGEGGEKQEDISTEAAGQDEMVDAAPALKPADMVTPQPVPVA